MILNKSERGGAGCISKALSKLTGSLLWGCRGDRAHMTEGQRWSYEMPLCNMDKLDVRERSETCTGWSKQRLCENVAAEGRRRERKVEKFNQVNERMCERRSSSTELVWLVEHARWRMHNHLGRLKVRLLKTQLTLFSLCVCEACEQQLQKASISMLEVLM